jgi:hypothetical protein
MNIPVADCIRPISQLRLSIEHDWHRVEGRMQSAPTKLGCSLPEMTLNLALNHCFYLK